MKQIMWKVFAIGLIAASCAPDTTKPLQEGMGTLKIGFSSHRHETGDFENPIFFSERLPSQVISPESMCPGVIDIKLIGGPAPFGFPFFGEYETTGVPNSMTFTQSGPNSFSVPTGTYDIAARGSFEQACYANSAKFHAMGSATGVVVSSGTTTATLAMTIASQATSLAIGAGSCNVTQFAKITFTGNTTCASSGNTLMVSPQFGPPISFTFDTNAGGSDLTLCPAPISPESVSFSKICSGGGTTSGTASSLVAGNNIVTLN